MLSNLLITLCLPFIVTFYVISPQVSDQSNIQLYFLLETTSYTSYSDALVAVLSNNFIIFARVCVLDVDNLSNISLSFGPFLF